MAEDRDLANEAALAAAARHALHDEELVAAYAASGLESDDEVAQARALVERCAVCRDLHRDVVAIGESLASAASFTARAPRDFRLTVEDAHRLGGRVVARGFLASMRRSLTAFARPAGAALATFGLVGVLVGSIGLSGGGTAGSLTSGAAPSSAPAEVQGGATLAGPKASANDTAYGPTATDDRTRAGTDGDRESGSGTPNPILWLFGGSIAMLLAGIGLLLLAVRRGRRTDAQP